MISNKNNQFLNSLKGHDGFTLIEIIMAISLIAVIFLLIPNDAFDAERENLEDTYMKIQRVVRAATDESILRNSIVRIKFEYGKENIEYSIEYGDGANLVLPENKDLSRLSLKEREEEAKKAEKFDSQFTKSADFQESNASLKVGVEMYGLGTTYLDSMKTEGPFYIYFFPTGDKDASFLVFYSLDEILTVETFPFEDRIDYNYIPFSDSDLANLEDAVENKANDLFDKWYRDEQ